MKYYIITLAVIGLLAIGVTTYSANDCTKITLDSTFKTKADKQATLENKIWQDIKRNEIPEWNPSIVSAEEMTGAYISLAQKKNSTSKKNLWNGMRDEVLREGVKCL